MTGALYLGDVMTVNQISYGLKLRFQKNMILVYSLVKLQFISICINLNYLC